jgi:hypothetical protein
MTILGHMYKQITGAPSAPSALVNRLVNKVADEILESLPRRSGKA